ncbi:MAG: ATP-binding cassette domain-containing protein, partial [Spirochaetaceae bacterium]|nr:ATP-binding cassette domain-containing protein [Spirochaetaceae bacterium]
MDEVAVSLKGINHRWPSNGVTACRNVSLDLHTGCLHALVGENGAGKTTLGLILSGVLKPDSGTVQLKSGNIDLKEKTRGLIPGIGLIRQRSIWPPVLSLKEAAVVGRSGEQSSFSKTAEKWNLNGINPDTRVSAMDAAGLQRAEMIAALMFNPEILILDEPSSAWEEGRGNEFYQLMKQLKGAGRTVMLITHRLDDVFSIADQVTVMRHGHVTGTWNVKDIDYSMLTREMFGEEESSDMPLIKKVLTPSPKVLQARIEAYRVGVSISGQKVLDGLSFKLHPGEILGITGLREEGLSYLEDVISGNLKIDTGSLILDSRPIPQGAPGMRKAGLHYVPS